MKTFDIVFGCLFAVVLYAQSALWLHHFFKRNDRSKRRPDPTLCLVLGIASFIVATVGGASFIAGGLLK